jgi:hypothetical protein
MDISYKLPVLYKSITGQEMEKIKEPNIVIDLLRKGEKDIIMDFIWKKELNEDNNRIQMVLQRIENKRIIFYNPLSHKENPGEELNLESINEEEFIDFFIEKDAICYIG